MLEVLQSTMQ